MIHEKENKSPSLNRPIFSVDNELHSKLNNFDLTKNMNRSNFTLFCSRPGGGKTSMIISFLNSPQLYKKVYHNIFLFMGKNSRDSIRGTFFDTQISPECIYDDLTKDTLMEVYEKVKTEAEEGYNSLIIFDDIQSKLKVPDIAKQLQHMSANRRHIRLSMWLANQNYNALPKQIRSLLTDMFIFNVSKQELNKINEEQLEIPDKTFQKITAMCFKEPHSFMYIHTNLAKIYNNWNEILYSDTV